MNTRHDMNTEQALSSISDDTLQEYLSSSNTWIEFKLKCGLPKSRRQDAIRAYLDSHNLDYSNLPSKGESGMKQQSPVWNIPEDQFRAYVAEAQSWSDLLDKCGCNTFGNIGTIRRRIRDMELDTTHIKSSQKLARKQLLEERGAKCEHCGLTNWHGFPIKYKLLRRQGSVKILCPNCAAISAKKRRDVVE